MILMKSKMLQSMKKIFSKVMLVAAAAMAFFACQKPEVIEPETSHEVMLTFSSEKPEFNDETKTEWTGETIQWSKGDKIRVAYTCNGVWQNADGNATSDETEGNKSAKLYASTELESAMEIATFKVPTTFKVNEDNENAVHEFYALYPSNLTTSTSLNFAPSVTVSLPANQTPSATSFDASADMMIAKSNFYTGIPTEAISLKWNRLVAHGYLTLKALAVDGPEKVESIVLTANAEADMVGKHYVDFETQVVTKSGETATNVITIDGTNLSIDADGNVSFWVSFLPCTWTSLKVEVETNKASYTREIDLSANQKTFVKNARNVLGIGMASATRVAKEAPVADYSGTYVIVAERNSEKKFYYMTAVDAGASTKRFVAVLAGETCPTDVEGLDDTYRWDISKSGDSYVVTSVQNGQSISWTSGNSAFLAPTGLPFEVTENENGTFTFKYAASDEDRYISLNNTTGNNYFALYKSGQAKDLYLLPVTPDTTPSVKLETEELELTSEESEGTIEVNAKNIASIEVRALVEKGSQDESDWLVAEYDEANSCVTYSALANESEESRTAFIEVYCLDAEDNEIIAGINVTQKGFATEPAGPQTITVADFLELKDTETEYILTGKITRVANTTYGNFDITDATGTVYVYGLLTPDGTAQKQWAAAGLKQGDIITIKGKYSVYNNSPQVKNAVYVSHKGISVDNSSLTFAAEGGYQDVTATLVNTTDAISVSVDNPHFTVALKSGNTYTVTAPANETEEDIYANLTFTAGELTAVVSISQVAPEVEEEVVGGRDDFNTVSANSGYSTRTTTAGWKGTNCAVMQGGTSDSNPTFKFIGSTNATRAFTINGKTTAKGVITSPTLTTGCGKLSLKYGNAFAESNGVDFTVTIKQNGTVVKTYKVDVNSVTQKKAYTWEQEVNVAGDFVIEITNNCPSNSTSNKDRVSIWDVEWTGYKN